MMLPCHPPPDPGGGGGMKQRPAKGHGLILLVSWCRTPSCTFSSRFLLLPHPLCKELPLGVKVRLSITLVSQQASFS